MIERKIRNSQAVVPFGVGSIVDFPDESLMACSIDYWKGGEVVNDERLQRRLYKFGITHFRKPPVVQDGGKIPFVRFPRWMFCPRCRDFKPVKEWQKEYEERKRKSFNVPRCSKCYSKLVPSRFVVSCERGHIDDFPWIEWVHKKDGICNNPKLKISTGTGSSGLSGIRVQCKNCNASETMSGAFHRGSLNNIKKCSGFKPWQPKEKNDDCNLELTTLQRGGSNVYFPSLISSIYIPEYTTVLEGLIRNTSGWKALLQAQETTDMENQEMLLDTFYSIIAKEINHDVNEVKRCTQNMLSNNNIDESDIGEVKYRYNEYTAFTGLVKVNSKSRDFTIETLGKNEHNLNFIESVTLAHKLREIRALLSFTRLKPVDTQEFIDEEEQSKTTIEPQLVSNNLRNVRWLPAIEVRGEGIFIRFNSNLIQKWSELAEVKKRANIINSRYRKVIMDRGGRTRKITEKFILLHTFAHILIRQLSFESGYSSASLRERIYCNEYGNQQPMEGILIYTASGDSDGTLGGLVREGRPDYLPSVIRNAIEKADWCSSDPLCLESNGQGLDSLNLAACHACVLLPETSCEERNRFLDRALLVGEVKKPEIGFFNFCSTSR